MEDGTYAPAHLLADGRMERAGRVKGSTESLQAVAVQGLPECGSFAHSAAVVVVGDELLSGKVRSHAMTSLHVQLTRWGGRGLRVPHIRQLGSLAGRSSSTAHYSQHNWVGRLTAADISNSISAGLHSKGWPVTPTWVTTPE